MGKRLDLHAKLVEILGSKNVYFQPPSTVTMQYPAIRYSLGRIDNRRAENSIYSTNKSYELTFMTKNPDDEIVDKLNELPMCRFDRFYTMDNLNHYVFTIYF